MLSTVIEFSRYWFALLFGTMIALSFAGMAHTLKNYLTVGCFSIVLFIMQLTCLHIWGMDYTIRIYPLLTHLPTSIFIVVYLKRSWLISIISVFSSFLCCQLSRWIGSVAGSIFSSATLNHLGYILSVFLMYYILQKFVVKSVYHMLVRSVKSCLLFGALPAFYYIFDYTATVYTDLMYSGARSVVQFMPFVTAAFYFVFVLLYYNETKKQSALEFERDMLDSQFKQARKEFVSLKQMQQSAATYRHDMRHHFSLLQVLASEGRIDEIKEYLRTAQSDIDAITPKRYCENETVNLILSSIAAKAEQSQICFALDANLPETLPFSDTELCSLLSNALENAIFACEKIPDSNKRFIKLRMYSKNNKLCIDIRNSTKTKPKFVQGLPVTNEQGHGFGIKSMVHIVEKQGGVYQFSTTDGCFIFQATI